MQMEIVTSERYSNSTNDLNPILTRSTHHIIHQDPVLISSHSDNHMSVVFQTRAYRGHCLQAFRKTVHLQKPIKFNTFDSRIISQVFV